MQYKQLKPHRVKSVRTKTGYMCPECGVNSVNGSITHKYNCTLMNSMLFSDMDHVLHYLTPKPTRIRADLSRKLP